MFSPLDPLLFVLYFYFRGPPVWRQAALIVGFFPALMWAMPAQPCGCLRVPFQRCSSYGRDVAYGAAIRSDLKNLASQQEIYFSDHETYSADPVQLGFTHSDGVEVTVFASQDGWSARATHAALEQSKSCAIYVGAAPVPIEQLEGAEPGELACAPFR